MQTNFYELLMLKMIIRGQSIYSMTKENFMNENMLIQSLNHYCEEEIRSGPIGGMAWDQVDWDAHDLIEQYG